MGRSGERHLANLTRYANDTMKPLSRITAALAVLALSGAWISTTQAAITDGLVAHLAFENTLNDSTPNALSGTAVGEPTFAKGFLGAGCVSLTSDAGAFNYVTLGTPELLKFGSVVDGTAVDFTISFWASYTNQSSDPVFIASQNWASSGNPGWGLYMQGGGNSRVVVSDGSTKSDFKPANVVRDGTWHHYLATFARTGEATVYIDGAFSTSKTMANVTKSIDVEAPINLGQDGTGAYNAHLVNLLMDDLGIWRRALSAGEVAAIFNAGKTGKNLEQVPAIPYPLVQSTTPAANAGGVIPNAPISVAINDGLTRLNTNNVLLTVNGVAVPVTVVKTGSSSVVSGTPTTLLPSGVSTATLVFANDATPAVLFTNTWSFTSTYVTLTPAIKVTPDTSKPGFSWRIFANQGNVATDNNRIEQALAGVLVDADGNPLTNLADPTAKGAASAASSAPSPDTASISFTIPTVINLNLADGGAAGSFLADDKMPGVPATDGSSDGLSAEIVTYIDLPAGVTTMGVASDDGFRTVVGFPLDAFSPQVAGQFDGGRGVAETLFHIFAQEAGTYAFRTLYENGTGDGSIEWYSLKADGTKVLINDLAHGGLRASSAITTIIPPYVQFVDPPATPRQFNLVTRTFTAVVVDGTQPVKDSSITLSIDGKPVTVTKTRQGKAVKVVYQPTVLSLPSEQYTAQLSFTDVGGTAYTPQWKFYNLKNLVLPAPKVTENFDSSDEGSVPTGWTAWNFTDCSGAFCETPGLDLDNLNSDSYKGFIVVSRDRLATLKSRIFKVAPGESVNGVALTEDDLSTGNLLYAESDVRDGNQAQFITSKAFNLSSITNVVLGFGSLYEQNQDSLGAVEYSIDGGVNWLPVVYFLDTKDSGGDIKLNADGSVDAIRTFKDANGDTAIWKDNGVNKGGNYGDGIAAPISQALAPFVTPRWNDDSRVDKRFEAFRLPLAGKKSDVRLRFAQLGTGSWYFGIDNLGFYEGPVPAVVTKSVLNVPVLAGTSVTLSWTGSGTLQEAASVSGPWTASSNQANPQTTPSTGAAKFYRLSP